MGAGSSLFLSNEELGKKDDDHKPTTLPPIRSSHWNAARAPPRKSVKRLLVAFAVGAAIYLFIKNIPTDVGIHDRRRPVYTPHNLDDDLRKPQPMPKLKPIEPVQPPKKPAKTKSPADDTAADSPYNGPVVFPNLAVSLQAIYSTRGGYVDNKNVLFAASSLKSAAALLPLACEMGAELTSYVHFALMSKSEIIVDELLNVNGIDDSCKIIFHDARPNLSASSTATRLKTGVVRAIFHINSYMHPQVVLIDGSETEESYFLDAMRAQSSEIPFNLIELPNNGLKRLNWISKLDSSALSAWNKVSIDILIHAPPDGAGNLIRLLKSLSAADYTACAIPHLTIELPNKVDPHTENFLENFQWPPAGIRNPTAARQLTLRHRITRSSMTEEESSVRLLESFWPVDPRYSHVLVLSPQAQLSPRFFHYLKYSVLQYSLSGTAAYQEWDSRLLGISLDLPPTYLNGSTTFSPPAPVKKDTVEPSSPRSESSTPFLWQAPNSNAVLYMGQKWIELHDFVSRLLYMQHNPATAPPPTFFSDKSVSKRYPSWLEHVLKLSRARGYWTVYPSKFMAKSLAVVHNELSSSPEEYKSEELPRRPADVTENSLASGPLLDSLPDTDFIPAFNDMPLLLWDGTDTTLDILDDEAAKYTARFRDAVGGCDVLDPDELLPIPKSTRDLFCSKGG
ncbi:hypothetical protein QBC37DRAFT_141170 [Rhypophila decipiens]|uniref:Glycosyltransferase 2 n=1 Tax=Rhypophila decipiens TaxID=261697 RepID=A0AAN6Y9U2_9PEZI|nr:hypothetical protein QBC37DRAFT_141170 [Rhypophila decipiens]